MGDFELNEIIKEIPDSEERGLHARELLKNKYGIQFEILESRPIILNYDYYNVISYAVVNPEILFEARVSFEHDSLSDEYAVKNACTEYCRMMLRRIKQLNGDIYIRMRSLVRGFEIDRNEINLNYLQEQFPGNSFIIDVYYSGSSDKKDDLYDTISEMLSGDELISGLLNVYYLTDITRRNVQKYIESHDREYIDFNDVLQGNKSLQFDIEKGKIKISKNEWLERINKYDIF